MNLIAWEDVWSFILGVGIGILVGGILVAIGMKAEEKGGKFCPTCGEIYGGNSVYCESDGTLLKERGN